MKHHGKEYWKYYWYVYLRHIHSYLRYCYICYVYTVPCNTFEQYTNLYDASNVMTDLSVIEWQNALPPSLISHARQSQSMRNWPMRKSFDWINVGGIANCQILCSDWSNLLCVHSQVCLRPCSQFSCRSAFKHTAIFWKALAFGELLGATRQDFRGSKWL